MELTDLCAPSGHLSPPPTHITLGGHPGGNPRGPHGPPVAVLTEWGPPSVRWQPPTGGSIYKIDALPSHSYHLLWEAHSDARLPDQPYNLSTRKNPGKILFEHWS